MVHQNMAPLVTSTTRIYFHCLAGLSVFLLWGISLINGTVWALLRTSLKGQLPSLEEFETSYTGFVLLDFPISLLVGFFYYGTNGHDPGYQNFLLNAYATLQPAYVWLYVESARFGNRLPFLKSPVFFGLLWQMFGAAIALPLFYAEHLGWGVDTKTMPATTLNQIRAIPLGFVIGAVVPVIIGMYPTWTGSEVRAARHHQLILAAWQSDPIWVSLIQLAIIGLMSRITLPRYNDHRTSSTYVRVCYLMAAFVSVIGHYHLIWRMTSSSDARMTLGRLFWPQGFYGPHDVADILVRGPWLFLQYDFIFIAFSSLSWVFVLLRRVDHNLGSLLLGCGLAASTISIGAGATVSLALLLREDKIRQASDLHIEEKPTTASDSEFDRAV